jgi:glycosyltransferase involved in cell wall biosynthesis
MTAAASEVELSVVIPCLDEAETIGTCVEKATRTLRENGIRGEVIVADNGSTDGSREIAERLGARVVPVPSRGYGAALMGGIAAARGPYVLMGDADASYDFGEIPRFLTRLREGFDLVQGCRLPAGGGTVSPGAMPPLHRWLGNPLFSMLSRLWFRAPINDSNCGMRAFRRDWYERLDQRCTGMEFANEMIIKAGVFQSRIAEVPITLHPDGRISRKPHLRTWRDGWRTLRFYLMYSPRWLFLIPGSALVLLGLLAYAIALPGLEINGVHFDVHTLLYASVMIICGYQSILFAVMTKTFAIREGLLPEDPRLTRMYRYANLESGLIAGTVTLMIGVGLLLAALVQWYRRDFGALDYVHTMRIVIPGAMLTTLGFQTIFSSFFLSILGLRSR